MVPVALSLRPRETHGEALIATLDDLAMLVQKVHRTTRNGLPAITAQCPAHDDKNPSFWAEAGDDGWLHVHCPLCSEADIERALGWVQDDRRIDGFDNPTAAPMPMVEYVYREADGSPVIRKTRYYKRTSGELKKSFFIEGYRNGEWITGLSHLNGSRDVLYQLPEILKHKESRPVYIVNGEKAADRLRKEKLLATCQAYGEGAKPEEARGKWKPIHGQYLRGATEVVIVADLDEVGESYAKFIAAQLTGIIPKISIVQSKTGKPKDDAYDHFEAGFTAKDLVKRPDLLPRRGIQRRHFEPEDFTPAELDWLFEPYVLKGKVYLLDAHAGVGKTSLALAWAAALSRGLHPLTFEPLECGPLKTLYLHKGEDEERELETVYRANKGVPGFIEFGGEDLYFNPGGLKQLEETIVDGGFGFVVVDALFYFLVGVVQNTGDPLQAVPIVTELNRIAARTRAFIMDLRHMRKTSKENAGDATEDGLGSITFRNSHRGQFIARWHPEDKGLVVVIDGRGSIMRESAEHFCYRRIGLEIEYVRAKDNPFDGGKTPPKNMMEAAKRFLEQMLTGAWVAAPTIFSAGMEAGFSETTIKRAKASLPISYRRGGPEGPVYATIDPFIDK